MEFIRFLLYVALVGVAALWVGWILWGTTNVIYPSAGDPTGMSLLNAVNYLIENGFTNIWIVQKDKYLGDQTIKLKLKDFHSPSKMQCYYWMSLWIVHEYSPMKREYMRLADKYYYHLCPFTKHSKVTLIAYFDDVVG